MENQHLKWINPLFLCLFSSSQGKFTRLGTSLRLLTWNPSLAAWIVPGAIRMLRTWGGGGSSKYLLLGETSIPVYYTTTIHTSTYVFVYMYECQCVYIYIYIHILYMYMYIYACLHTYLHTWICISIRVYIHTYIYIQTPFWS